MVDNNDVTLQWFKQDQKQFLISLKKKVKGAEFTLGRYLEVLPKVEVKMRGYDKSRTYPCEEWLFHLALDIKTHCSHCKYESSCQQQCESTFLNFWKSFCEMCTADKTDRCRVTIKRRLQSSLNRKMADPPSFANQFYVAFCTFDYTKGVNTYLSFPFIDFVITCPDAKNQSDISSEFNKYSNKLRAFALKWLGLTVTDNFSERQIVESALTIIAFHYLLIKDIMTVNLFAGAPEIKDGKTDFDDHESTNVIASYVFSRDGLPEDEVEELLNANTNPDEVLIGWKKPTESRITFGNQDIDTLISSIENIYNSRLLHIAMLKDIESNWGKIIKKHIRNKNFRSTNVQYSKMGARSDNDLDPKYFQYKLYTRFAAFIEAIRRTRFTNKTPKIFQNDNLENLYEILFHQEETDLKKACTSIGMHYTTVHMALDAHKKRHPEYDRIQGNIKEWEGYGTLSNYLTDATLEEVLKWKSNVTDLKK